MAKLSRTKGRRGESEAKQLLISLDYEVDDLNNGLSTCDLLATDSSGVTWSVEVKKNKKIDIPSFRRQAMDNGTQRKPWMLMCHIDNTKSWLVLRQGKLPEVWHDEQHK